MEIKSSILFGRVMHKRLFPKVNAFAYRIYYLALPLSKMNSLSLARNRFALLSFYDCDHGARDGSDLEEWARRILSEYNITEANGEILLVCMPRVLGYVFNPVSFWLCHDAEGKLRAVLCEVHNTFGECHTYLCAHDDHRSILSDDVLTGQKLFHVSPFIAREGYYTFRFHMHRSKLAMWINFHDSSGNKQLMTSLTGSFEPMGGGALRKAFWFYPLVTIKAMVLIHWQALKLWRNGMKHISKPQQKTEVISATGNLTKVNKM